MDAATLLAAAWLTACLRDNPGLASAQSAGLSPEHWDGACHAFQEPCLEIEDPRDQLSVGRCVRLCGAHFAGASPSPEALSDCYYRSRFVAPPPRPRVARALSRYSRVALIVHELLDRAVAGGRTAEGLPARTSRQAVCDAYEAAQNRRRSDESVELRDAEHYLFSYCHVASRDSAVFRWPEGVVWCGVVYGYTFTKAVLDATLTDPVMGPGRNLLAAGDTGVSEPSMDEIRWGCWGAGDAARRELVRDPRRRGD